MHFSSNPLPKFEKTSIPCSSRNLTRSTWPSCAASIRGVDEPCSMEAPMTKENKIENKPKFKDKEFCLMKQDNYLNVLYLLEEEMQLHLENLHNKPSSKLSPESPLFVHECQLLEQNREQLILQNHINATHLSQWNRFSFTMFKKQSNHIQMSFPGGFHERCVPKKQVQCDTQTYVSVKDSSFKTLLQASTIIPVISFSIKHHSFIINLPFIIDFFQESTSFDEQVSKLHMTSTGCQSQRWLKTVCWHVNLLKLL